MFIDLLMSVFSFVIIYQHVYDNHSNIYMYVQTGDSLVPSWGLRQKRSYFNVVNVL